MYRHVALALVVAAAVQVLTLAASLAAGVRAVDALAGAGAAAIVGAVTWLDPPPRAGRRAAAVALLLAWALRLGYHLYSRNKPPRVGVHVLVVARALWSFGAALPVLLLLASPTAPDTLRPVEVAACVAAAAALLVQAGADSQKSRWRRDPGGGAPVCGCGMWSWSRHPNLFGEAVFHWALWAVTARGTSALTVAAPALMAWHLAAHDMGPLVVQERGRALAHNADQTYARYVESTSPVLPMPPGVWAAAPAGVRAVLLERPDWKAGAVIALLSQGQLELF